MDFFLEFLLILKIFVAPLGYAFLLLSGFGIRKCTSGVQVIKYQR